MKLVRAVYGLKILGLSKRKMSKYHIVNCLKFSPSTIDPDMYYQRNTKEVGTGYYEILLFYVVNVYACSHDTEAVMAVIKEKFEIKNDNISESILYLGGNIEKS